MICPACGAAIIYCCSSWLTRVFNPDSHQIPIPVWNEIAIINAIGTRLSKCQPPCSRCYFQPLQIAPHSLVAQFQVLSFKKTVLKRARLFCDGRVNRQVRQGGRRRVFCFNGSRSRIEVGIDLRV
jgi:hypothetical protein